MNIKTNGFSAYLDDVRPKPDDYDVLWTSFGEAIHWMSKHGCPRKISFDHDLGPVDVVASYYFRTGMDVAKFIVNTDLETGGRFIPDNFTWEIHSMNRVGAKNIDEYLRSYLTSKGTTA